MDQTIKSITLVIPLLISSLLILNAQPVQSTMKRLPDTGQTKSYTTTWGEDSDYLFYTPAFSVVTPGVVLDTVTGLMWQQADSGEMTYEKALAYADTLRLGGFDDWRLPSAMEAFSLFNHQSPNPAFDAAYFIKTGGEYWWTRDKQVNDAAKIWVINGGGGIGNHNKTETISAGGTKKYHARCVRQVSLPTIHPQRFTDHGDGTVTDHVTRLMWRKSPATGLSWEEALMAAENASLAGYSDWRLPNIKELRSLSDETKFNPSVDKTIFPQITTGRYWSSTSLPNQTTRAWFWDTQYGITTYEVKTIAYGALFVRSAETVSTGTRPAIAESFTIHPNPFTGIVRFDGNITADRLDIHDLSGKLIYTLPWQAEMDLSHLRPAVYVASVIRDNRVIGQVRIVRTEK